MTSTGMLLQAKETTLVQNQLLTFVLFISKSISSGQKNQGLNTLYQYKIYNPARQFRGQVAKQKEYDNIFLGIPCKRDTGDLNNRDFPTISLRIRCIHTE